MPNLEIVFAETVIETKRLFHAYLTRLNNPNDWPMQSGAMALCVILIGAWLWPENPDPIGWFRAYMLPVMGLFFVISLVTAPLQAAWEIRKGKRSAIEARTIVILLWLGILIIPIVGLTVVGVLSWPVGFIYRTIPTLIFGDGGLIVGGIAMFATIPVMWKLLGVTKDTGFQRGFKRYMNDLRDQMDDRQKGDVYDSEGNKVGSLRIENR
jgi:hypothetical protein